MLCHVLLSKQNIEVENERFEAQEREQKAETTPQRT